MSDDRLRDAAIDVLGRTFGSHTIHPDDIPDCEVCTLRAAIAEPVASTTALDVLARWGFDRHEPFCVPARECTCRRQIYAELAEAEQSASDTCGRICIHIDTCPVHRTEHLRGAK